MLLTGFRACHAESPNPFLTLWQLPPAPSSRWHAAAGGAGLDRRPWTCLLSSANSASVGQPDWPGTHLHEPDGMPVAALESSGVTREAGAGGSAKNGSG